jgi:hypothetical protein
MKEKTKTQVVLKDNKDNKKKEEVKNDKILGDK